MISDGQSVLVIVPAYDEEGAVGHVVKSVLEVLGDTPIVVIDDGSQDATAEVATAAGAEVFRLPHHLGLGGAVQTGYRFAFEQGFDRVVRVDGDGQHNPSDIPTLLKAMDEGGYDMVTGSRYLGPNDYPIQPLRRFGGPDLLVGPLSHPWQTHHGSDVGLCGGQPTGAGSLQPEFSPGIP